MPPCGNFGLLILGDDKTNFVVSSPVANKKKIKVKSSLDKYKVAAENLSYDDSSSEDASHSDEDKSSADSDDENSAGDDSKTSSSDNSSFTDVFSKIQEITKSTPKTAKKVTLLPPLKILENQALRTEMRGGQAGGISSLATHKNSINPYSVRVRIVGRKRHPLAVDLIESLKKKIGTTKLDTTSTMTFLCHSRFATSSINVVSELHPHEWVKSHPESVWKVNQQTGRFEKFVLDVVIHTSHNGDFDALSMYESSVPVGDVGLWLERVLYTPNSTKGDSPKIAGCLDLFRVQGRWAAAARLSYVKTILTSPSEVSNDTPLSKSAPTSFPPKSYWEEWAAFFDVVWMQHINNVIKVNFVKNSSGEYQHRIIHSGERQFIRALLSSRQLRPPIDDWSIYEYKSFIMVAVRGFLRADLYNAMTEFLSRGTGSFGIQAHCSLEPGVYVIASKSQPMSIGFDPQHAICLFASEPEAVTVPIDTEGHWLPNRIDLDNRGEVMRIGTPRLVLEGSFCKGKVSPNEWDCENCLHLQSGLELKAYCLDGYERTEDDIKSRVKFVTHSPLMYDPRKTDLVAMDLKATPSTLSAIDRAWRNKNSLEYISAKALCERLLISVKYRSKANLDSIDLLITGIEASLWVAEQFAVDLQNLFPQINIHTVSSNKILNLPTHHVDDDKKKHKLVGKNSLARKITDFTIMLIISQSGQTFPTVHVTRQFCKILGDRVWMVTGCENSLMVRFLMESYIERGEVYGNNRVFHNYSNNRPAEPTSLAIVSTIHTLSRMLLFLVDHVFSGNDRRASRITSSPDHRASHLHNHHSGDHQETAESAGGIVASTGQSVLASPLTRLCARDLQAIYDHCLVNNISEIVGHDIHGDALDTDTNTDTDKLTIHDALRKQGKEWGRHVSEPWNILVFVGFYIVLSVGLGAPIFGVIADQIAYTQNISGVLSFSLRNLSVVFSQPIGYTLLGLVIQIADALWFIYLAKISTWGLRVFQGRPVWARHGRRTVVIVDVPHVHQLVEAYLSKLFSMSYGTIGLDVHGANGLDHFVHRFTHRVVRGVLIAVGRPDGRLSHLSKSECAVLLSCKQAAFIRNGVYGGSSSGPEFVTIGHNSFIPNLGRSSHILLNGSRRGQFFDEVMYDRLSMNSTPITGFILRQYSPKISGCRYGEGILKDVYGCQHIDTNIVRIETTTESLAKIFDVKKLIKLNKSIDLAIITGTNAKKMTSEDPSTRDAFFSRLDTVARDVVDSQSYLQDFYENRIASVERYMAFCVMFHALASSVNKPLFRDSWDIAKSQSNLRIATTAAPVIASNDYSVEFTQELHSIIKIFVSKLRGFKINF